MSQTNTWILTANQVNAKLNAMRGNLVRNGMAVTERGAGQNQTVDVASGDCIVKGVYYPFEATTNVALDAADGANPRKDLVCVNDSGVIVSSTLDANLKGVAAAAVGGTGPTTTAPVAKNIPADFIILAEVWVPAADATVEDAAITDRRILGPQVFPENMRPWVVMGTLSAQAGYLRSGYIHFRLGKTQRLPLNIYTEATGWETRGSTYGLLYAPVACWDSQVDCGFGTYQFTCQFDDWAVGKAIALGLWWHYQCLEMGAYYYKENTAGAEYTRTTNGGVLDQDVLADWDESAETVLKIEWVAASVKFYVAGALKNTHAVTVPDEQMQFGLEITHYPKASNYTDTSVWWLKEFQRIA